MRVTLQTNRNAARLLCSSSEGATDSGEHRARGRRDAGWRLRIGRLPSSRHACAGRFRRGLRARRNGLPDSLAQEQLLPPSGPPEVSASLLSVSSPKGDLLYAEGVQ